MFDHCDRSICPSRSDPGDSSAGAPGSSAVSPRRRVGRLSGSCVSPRNAEPGAFKFSRARVYITEPVGEVDSLSKLSSLGQNRLGLGALSLATGLPEHRTWPTSSVHAVCAGVANVKCTTSPGVLHRSVLRYRRDSFPPRRQRFYRAPIVDLTQGSHRECLVRSR